MVAPPFVGGFKRDFRFRETSKTSQPIGIS